MPDVEVVITPTPDVVVEVTEEGSPPVSVTLTPPPEVVEVQVPGPAGPQGEQGPQGEPGEGGGASTWDELTGKPSTFPPSAHEHDHIINLTRNSRTEDSVITDYPTGFSVMMVDFDHPGPGFSENSDIQFVYTSRQLSPNYNGPGDAAELGVQWIVDSYEMVFRWRAWEPESEGWGTWQDLARPFWANIQNKPSTFPPEAHAASHKGDGSDPIANATTSVAGLESAADKTKLDGIESGATADQSAAEILTAIKTVDGSGSGLDADLLDGSNSSAFAAASHAASHVTGGSDVIANAVAGGNAGLLSGTDKTKLDGIESGATGDQTAAEIRGAIKLAEDAFDGSAGISSFDVGVSYLPVSTSSTGWPIAATTFHVLILKQDGSSAKQVAIQRAAARHWERHWTGSAWSSWVETTDVANLTGYSALATDAEVTSAISAHEALSDPHPGYLTPAEANALYKAIGYVPDWADITGKPSTFAPSAHASSHTNGTDDIQSATASQKGLMTSTYASKVDGIESGATQDQTPAEIRAALKYATDALAESAAITSFDEGVSLMLTTAGANWGPNTGEAGRVLTERTGSVGTQQFLTDNGKVFYRSYSGSWGSWAETNAWNDLTGKPSTFAPSTHAATHVNGTDDIQSATAGQKGLMTSAYASKLDGIESGATQDQTAAEILTAIKTVDGSTSGLDADLLDGHDTAYFATATDLSSHLADTSDAHDASAISVLDTGANFTGSDVETVLAEIADSATATGLLNTVEVNLGTVPRRGGHFDITTSGLTVGQNVIIEQMNGPYTGKGTQADEAEMDQLTVTGQAISNTVIRCYWNSTTHVRGNFKFAYTLVSTLNTVPEATTTTSGLLKSAFQQTHIEGLILVWNSPGTNGTNLTVTSGSAWIPSLSAIMNVPSDLTGPSMSFAASTWYYVYLTSSGTLEISTTAPASPYKGTARTKASDTSRRYLGAIKTNAAGTPAMWKFRDAPGGTRMWLDNTAPAPFLVVNADSSTTVQTPTCAGVVPSSSQLAYLFCQSNVAVVVWLGAGDLPGTLTSGNNTSAVLGNSIITSPMELSSTQTFQFLNNSAGGSFFVRVLGYMEER